MGATELYVENGCKSFIQPNQPSSRNRFHLELFTGPNMAFFFSQLKEFLPIFLKLAGCWGGLNLTAVASFLHWLETKFHLSEKQNTFFYLAFQSFKNTSLLLSSFIHRSWLHST